LDADPPPQGVNFPRRNTYDGLRTAVLALCPLNADQLEALNERMEMIYPRSLRGLRLAAEGGNVQEH